MPNYTGGNVASDNCGLASVVQSPAAGTVLNGVGTTTVILTATDLSGNTASCSFTVSTVDVTAPVIACAANIVQNVSCAPATITLTNPTATDACGGNVTIVRSYTGSTFPLGTTNV
ncbi:MAG: HYR domain-containing protein, partial [bacterium]